MPNRPIRIAGVSGSASDRRDAIRAVVSAFPTDPVDVLIGDWMSEGNMTSRAVSKVDGTGDTFEQTFLEALEPAIDDIAKYKIKMAVNAGAVGTKELRDVVVKLVEERKLGLKVAWVEGDECLDAVKKLQQGGEKFENICTGEELGDWKFEPVFAQAYLGGLGIAEAFRNGADIVLCGRVSDASPVIGASYWWHNWARTDLKQLANALVGGHLVECSSYVVGGNFTGFKVLEETGWDDIGYPIAEISAEGEVIITKNAGSKGMITVDTCTSQLLYEIQGPWYYNSDVTAILSGLYFEQVGPDRVALRGVEGAPPPPTTKVGITAKGGYQAEIHWALVGLDIPEKARMLEAQIRRLLAPYSDDFSLLAFTVNGTVAEDASNQSAATVDFRVVAQARNAADLAPHKFVRPCLDCIMSAPPGATPHFDFRTGIPRPIYEYYVTLLPQAEVRHQVHLHTGETVDIGPPPATKVWDRQQPSEPTTAQPADLQSFGETTRGPIGWIVHARSGDKGSNANVGFWVRHADEYAWLQTVLSADAIKGLLGDEYKQGHKVDRFELPNARAVHFLLHDHLDRGISCSSTYDVLGKNVAEYLRNRHVDIPVKFLARKKL